MAGFPTSASRAQLATRQSDFLDQAMVRLRATATQWNADLAAGPVDVQDLIDGLWSQLQAERDTINTALNTEGALDVHGDNLLLRARLYAADINLGTDRFVVDHAFLQGDPIRVRALGESTPPSYGGAGAVSPFDGWATVITAGGFKIADSLVNAQADTPIDLTGPVTGEFQVTFRLVANANQVVTEIGDALTWLDTNLPKDVSDRVLAYTLDPTGATGAQGVVAETLTSAQTAGLRSALDAIIAEIEAPA